MTLMRAEILFLDPADKDPCVAMLTERGFSIEHLDWVDPYGPTVWIMAWIDSDRVPDTGRLLDWALSLVEPLGGDVVEASRIEA